jgi:murein DD-endopeptidase MepM/ murein hydrolase activator NlpD
MKRRQNYELSSRLKTKRRNASASAILFVGLFIVGLVVVALGLTDFLKNTPSLPSVAMPSVPSFLLRNVRAQQVEATSIPLPPVITPFTVEPQVVERSFAVITATTAPVETREMLTHTVIDGDTLFGIALKYGLAPETVLWSNYAELRDDPDLLSIGQQLRVPPRNGLIVTVEGGDTIDSIARRFKVTPDVIVSEPINKLTNINQAILVGQDLFVPGGERETVTWQVPVAVQVRVNTVTGAKVYRVGNCGEIEIPSLGTGRFVWPANRRTLSGYDFTRWHAGLDISGRLGEPIYAVDGGTVIYSGYSLNAAGRPVGYGQYIVLDHGNGYKSLYAHVSQRYVKCGQQVRKGAVIAAVGSVGKSTGPHLHFELRFNSGSGDGAVNPWSIFPK